MPSENPYPESSALVNAAENIWEGSESRVTISMTVSERLRSEMEDEFGMALESVFITDSDIRHIKKKHGSSEGSRRQRNIGPEDFECLPAIINDFDKVSHTDTDKLGNMKFLFSKEIGCIAYVATVQRGKRKLEIKTFWKKSLPGASC